MICTKDVKGTPPPACPVDALPPMPLSKRDNPACKQNLDAWHSVVSRSRQQQHSNNTRSDGSAVSREHLRDHERLAGRAPQGDSETCDERSEYGRLRASQWDTTAATRYRCVELEVVLNVGWSD